MKFCKYCGTQIEDNEVCKCDAAQRENASDGDIAIGRTEQTVNTATSDLSNAMKAYQALYISSWKKPTETIRAEMASKNHLLTAINIVLYFIGLLLFNCAFISKVPEFVGELLGKLDDWLDISSKMFDFSKVLSMSFVFLLIISVGCTMGSYILLKSNKAEINLEDSVTAFSVYLLPATTMLLVASLFTLMHPGVGLVLAGVSVVYLMIGNLHFAMSGLSAIDNAKVIYTVTTIVSVFILILMYASVKNFIWNVTPSGFEF